MSHVTDGPQSPTAASRDQRPKTRMSELSIAWVRVMFDLLRAKREAEDAKLGGVAYAAWQRFRSILQTQRTEATKWELLTPQPTQNYPALIEPAHGTRAARTQVGNKPDEKLTSVEEVLASWLSVYPQWAELAIEMHYVHNGRPGATFPNERTDVNRPFLLQWAVNAMNCLHWHDRVIEETTGPRSHFKESWKHCAAAKSIAIGVQTAQRGLGDETDRVEDVPPPDPKDDQYNLACWFVSQGKYAEAEGILKKHFQENAVWAFDWACLDPDLRILETDGAAGWKAIRKDQKGKAHYDPLADPPGSAWLMRLAFAHHAAVVAFDVPESFLNELLQRLRQALEQCQRDGGATYEKPCVQLFRPENRSEHLDTQLAGCRDLVILGDPPADSCLEIELFKRQVERESSGWFRKELTEPTPQGDGIFILVKRLVDQLIAPRMPAHE